MRREVRPHKYLVTRNVGGSNNDAATGPTSLVLEIPPGRHVADQDKAQRPKSVEPSSTTLLERSRYAWAEQRGKLQAWEVYGKPGRVERAAANLCPRPISQQMCPAASRPPSAREMEWLRNNYFLLSLISKSGMQMETEETAAGAWSQGQTGDADQPIWICGRPDQSNPIMNNSRLSLLPGRHFFMMADN